MTPQQKYRKTHRDELREKARKYRATGKHREAARRYRERHPDRVRDSQQKYRDANHLLLQAKQQGYYELHKFDADFMERRRESNRQSYARCKQRRERWFAESIARMKAHLRGKPFAGRFGIVWRDDAWQKSCGHSRTPNPCKKCRSAAERFTAESGVSCFVAVTHVYKAGTSHAQRFGVVWHGGRWIKFCLCESANPCRKCRSVAKQFSAATSVPCQTTCSTESDLRAMGFAV